MSDHFVRTFTLTYRGLVRARPGVIPRHGLQWHTAVGDICVIEPQYRRGSKWLRPLARSAGARARCCWRLLRRALTDLAADLPYAKAMDRLLGGCLQGVTRGMILQPQLQLLQRGTHAPSHPTEMNPSIELQSRLLTVRGHYRVTPWIQPRDDESPLLRSWQRCRDAGMREHERVNFELVSRAMLADLDEVHGGLVRRARPETERLASALRGTGCVVLLFNQRGVVIDRVCQESATPAVLLASTRKGINVSERCVGTSAPAISIAEGVPYLVGRDAHFFSNVRPFFCVAAPIDSPAGERLGALDITAYDKVPSFDIYALVVDAAAAIENSLFQPGPDRVVVRFHPRAELIGTPLEGLLAVDHDGRLCGANRVAARLLCLPRQGLLGRTFGELFDRRLQALFGRAGAARADLVEMLTHVGLQVMARFECGVDDARPGMVWPLGRLAAVAEPAGLAASAAAPSGKMRELELHAIESTLIAFKGNVSAAARQLGISRNTIYRRRGA